MSIISAEGHVIAMLCLFDFKPRPDFGKAHELQAENIARVIAQTIENWSLRQEIERLEKERLLLSKIVDKERREPPSGDVTMVFTDVESSTLLWEQNASAMEAALKMHDSIMRKCCADACGYEVTTQGDSFILAFHDPVDAVSFALAAQKELYQASWPQALLELPNTAIDLTKALRGLRVRMGIHQGPVSTSEHQVTGRIRYTGEVVRLTKSIEGMCHGGQILITIDAWRMSSSMIESLGSPQVLDLGEHVLLTGACIHDGIIAKRVLQLVPKELAFDYSLAHARDTVNVGDTFRGRRFPPPITKRKLSSSFHDAPFADGIVTVAFVVLPGIESLSDDVADATVSIVGKVLRTLLLKVNGYECKEDRGIWMIAFETPLMAVQFGLSLMGSIHDAATLDRSVDRKALVKIGVHTDAFKSMAPHPTTGRAD